MAKQARSPPELRDFHCVLVGVVREIVHAHNNILQRLPFEEGRNGPSKSMSTFSKLVAEAA